MCIRQVRPQYVAALWVVVFSLLSAMPSPAQQSARHVQFTATVRPQDPFLDSSDPKKPSTISVQRGETFTLDLRASLSPEWYTYPFTVRGSDQPVAQLGKITFVSSESFQPIYPVEESPPEWKQYGEEYYLIHPHPFSVFQRVYVKPQAKPGEHRLILKIRLQVCKKICTWEDHELAVSIQISDVAAIPTTPQIEKLLANKSSEPQVMNPLNGMRATSTGTATPSKNESSEQPQSPSSGASETKKSAGFWARILTAILGGYVSLLTPCVFPMIPITVSYFLKQSETGKTATLTMASVYCLTLVAVLSAGGLLLLQVLVEISVHWITNFLLGGIFLFFALSLLGMYDITLPSWLQDATASGENRGGLIGVFFMALTFSIVSFACVGPIYGGFISVGATDQSRVAYLGQVLSVFAFSIAFASPFFLLALFPSLLRTMPRAGSWMNSVKVVMGFLELAAVVKFLRAAELSYTRSSTFFTFDFSLGLYVAISIACSLYLLGMYRLPHDHDVAETIGVPRLIFSLAFLSLGIYLTPGLFKTASGDSQRPRGITFAWVESFLLPDVEGEKEPGSYSPSSTQLVWKSSLKEALSQAERENKLVFIDFTGMLCTNCKLNERNVFTRPEVKAALNQHVLLKLYTDYVPSGIQQEPNAEEAFEFRNKRFDTIALPLYVLVKPKGDDFEVVRKDEQGLIENVPEFVRFLGN